MRRVYLDFAAATPVDDAVMRAMLPFFKDEFYNPSALYSGARQARESFEAARSQVAQTIGARPAEIVFTAGGTESTNLAIHGIMRRYPGARILVSAIEHEAVLRPAEQHAHTQLPVTDLGIVNVDKTRRLIDDSTVLVSVMYANNEIGTVQPLSDLVHILQEVRADRKKRGVDLPIYLHTDACQAPLYLDIHVARLGVDLMSLNGGKIHGPKQSGILYTRAGIALDSLISGGGQEWGLRQGTENVPFAVGFATALERAVSGRKERVIKVSTLRDKLIEGLEARFTAEITGHRIHRIANNVHTVFPGTDNERVLYALDESGIDAATGSACSASKDTPSHVLLALGKTEEQARASLRFSLGKTTTEIEITRTLSILKKALKA